MKLVYIAGPFTPTSTQRSEILQDWQIGGNKHGIPVLDEAWAIRANVDAATALALRVASSSHMPVCPHSNTGDPRFLALQTPEWWYAATLELMRHCDAIALTDDWQESNGACREVIEAHELGLMLWADGELRPTPLHLHTEAHAALRSRGQEP